MIRSVQRMPPDLNGPADMDWIAGVVGEVLDR